MESALQHGAIKMPADHETTESREAKILHARDFRLCLSFAVKPAIACLGAGAPSLSPVIPLGDPQLFDLPVK